MPFSFPDEYIRAALVDGVFDATLTPLRGYAIESEAPATLTGYRVSRVDYSDGTSDETPVGQPAWLQPPTLVAHADGPDGKRRYSPAVVIEEYGWDLVAPVGHRVETVWIEFTVANPLTATFAVPYLPSSVVWEPAQIQVVGVDGQPEPPSVSNRLLVLLNENAGGIVLKMFDIADLVGNVFTETIIPLADPNAFNNTRAAVLVDDALRRIWIPVPDTPEVRCVGYDGTAYPAINLPDAPHFPLDVARRPSTGQFFYTVNSGTSGVYRCEADGSGGVNFQGVEVLNGNPAGGTYGNGLAYDVANDRLIVYNASTNNIIAVDPDSGAVTTLESSRTAPGFYTGVEVSAEGDLAFVYTGSVTRADLVDDSISTISTNMTKGAYIQHINKFIGRNGTSQIIVMNGDGTGATSLSNTFSGESWRAVSQINF